MLGRSPTGAIFSIWLNWNNSRLLHVAVHNFGWFIPSAVEVIGKLLLPFGQKFVL
jgi:hypothetical protein